MMGENGEGWEWFGWKPIGGGKRKPQRIVSYGEQCRQEEGKKEEGLVEEDDILEEVVCPNIHLAKKAACQNVVVKCT